MKLLAATLLLVIPCIGGEDTKEEALPTPEPYRRAPPRRTNGGYGSSASQSDISDAYQMLKDYRTVNRGSQHRLSNSNYDMYEDDDMNVGGADRLSKNGYDSTGYGAASEYGGYSSDSGYGLSCASGYVNASAVALLAFLFLLNIVQDVIQQITGGRRKRSLEEEDDSYSGSVMQFLSDGGVDALKEGVPEVMFNLLVGLATASDVTCQQRPLCEANKSMTESFGPVGQVIAYLSSNVLSKAFSGGHSHNFHLSQKASLAGRNGGNCERYSKCNGSDHFKDGGDSSYHNNKIY